MTKIYFMIKVYNHFTVNKLQNLYHLLLITLYIYIKEQSKPKIKDLNSMYTGYIDEVDTAIAECLDRKDINSKMYILKTLINKTWSSESNSS